MKRAIPLAIIILFLYTQKMYSQNLSDYTWKNRILILSDTDLERSSSKRAFDVVNSQLNSWQERDVVVLFLFNGNLTTTSEERINYKREFPEKFNGYILIGKDGGIKLKETYPLIPKKVFDLIDSMPMRKAEMRVNKDQ